MTVFRSTLASLACAVVLSGCTTVPPGNGSDPEYVGPAIIDLSPSPGQTDFFFGDNLWVVFEFAPESALLTLLDGDGNTVPGASTTSEDGARYTFDPSTFLQPSSDYTLQVQAGSLAGPPLHVAFRTSAHGLPTNPEAGGLGGAVFLVDVSNAVLLEPAIAGAVVLSEIESWNLLMGFAEQSSFEAAEQPGVHLSASLGRATDLGWEQDPCARTASFSLGSDGLYGTADDTPATWNDPRLEFGPRDIDFLVGLVRASVKDLHFEGLFHPDLLDMRDFSVEGIFDTRALDVVFQSASEEGITCDLLEALEIPCQECGGDFPGPFCVPIRGNQISATRVAIPALKPWTCADVVAYGLDTGECSKQIAAWEPAADGSYALCPEYNPAAP